MRKSIRRRSGTVLCLLAAGIMSLVAPAMAAPTEGICTGLSMIQQRTRASISSGSCEVVAARAISFHTDSGCRAADSQRNLSRVTLVRTATS
jgi:hypothetical protein